MKSSIAGLIEASLRVKQSFLADTDTQQILQNCVEVMVKTFRSDGKVLFCGNGGSAADAQHIAAELSGRFYTDREPLYAEALHVNSSYLTAVANDYSYEEVFARMVRACGRKGDILVGLSTSGNSKNVLKAMQDARDRGMITIGLTGQKGGAMRDLSDFLLTAPSNDTPRIQECHILMGHILCQLVEEELFG